MGHANKLLLCRALQTMLRRDLQIINNAEKLLKRAIRIRGVNYATVTITMWNTEPDF